MFTHDEISEMFRKGTLNGKTIERGKIIAAQNQHAQYKKCVVIVDREYYEITQIYPYKENRENPETITLYYKIKAL